MDLLSAADRNEWRNAINDVVDTFAKFTITYCQHGQQFDRWSEENPSPSIIKTDLLCLIEFKMEGEDAETKREQGGTMDIQQLKVTFGIDYLESVDMIDPATKEGRFDRGKDYFIYEEVKYRLIAMVADGPIGDKNALIILTLVKEEKNA